jgi:hypothetical protein
MSMESPLPPLCRKASEPLQAESGGVNRADALHAVRRGGKLRVESGWDCNVARSRAMVGLEGSILICSMHITRAIANTGSSSDHNTVFLSLPAATSRLTHYCLLT